MSASDTSTEFFLYRYLVTVDTVNFQPDLFDETISTPEQLNTQEKKREIMESALNKLHEATKDDTMSFHTVLNAAESHQYLFRLQVRSRKFVENNFETQEVAHNPSLWLAIDTEAQLIAVERKGREYGNNGKRAIRELEGTISPILRHKSLTLSIFPKQIEGSFWKFAEEHEGRIRGVRFCINAPNLPNLSRTLEEDIRSMMTTTNSHTGEVALIAAPNSSLALQQGSGKLDSLIAYTEGGGGKCKFQMVGEQGSRALNKQETLKATPNPGNMVPETDMSNPRTGILTKLKLYAKKLIG